MWFLETMHVVLANGEPDAGWHSMPSINCLCSFPEDIFGELRVQRIRYCAEVARTRRHSFG